MSSSAAEELLLSLGLPASTCPRYEYRNVDDFASVLDTEYKLFEADDTRSQYIAFCGLTKSHFDQDFLEPKSGVLTFESYFPSLNLLLIKMEYEPHSTAAVKFGFMLVTQLLSMNNERLDRKLTPIGTAHFRAVDRTKRADASFRPRRLGPSRDRQWPSLIVEVGFSEPYRKLKEDSRWWLTASNNEVKTAILISINRRYREITIEKWINQGQPTMDHRIVISQEPGRSEVKLTNNHPFIIPFDNLFLRAPAANEHDIIFSTDDWENFAETVWEVQFEQNYKQMT